MRTNSRKSLMVVVLVFELMGATFCLSPNATASNTLSLALNSELPTPTPTPAPSNSPATTSTPETEETLKNRESARNGIVVDQPRVYDDAMLQQMLRVAEARLAQLQVLDATSIASRLGAVTGASQRISSVGLNVQGLPLPQVVTTGKGATGTTTQTDQTVGTVSGSETDEPEGITTTSGLNTVTTAGLQTVSGLATQDVVTTKGQFGPPGATAPSPTTTLPSAGFSVSSSDILNEQMQLTAEINGLRLMLAGDLSGHFFRKNPAVTKYKTTLGFPIAVIPDERRKDMVAVVEVEVERTRTADSTEKENPMITALLPREKTYNVASITDKSVSIGGGVATQLLGFSGSWLWGHKTYYLVQDQDTVALTFPPKNKERVGFMWEFRPVLGQRFVKAGLKQTFVQIAFDAPANADEGEIGKVYVRTYWREYDRKRGIHKKIVGGSLSTEISFEIPRYSLAVKPPSFNSDNLEEIAPGEILVNLKGRFLPGTYVRIGSEIINALPRLLHEHKSLRFTAPIADLANKEVYLVAHDGTEVALKLRECNKPDLQDQKPIGTTETKFVLAGEPAIKVLDDTKSQVKTKFAVQETITRLGVKPVVTTRSPLDLPQLDDSALVLMVAGRVFGYSELKRNGDQLTVVVPTKELAAKPEMSIQTLFSKDSCRNDPVDVASFIPAGNPERLVVLEHRPNETKFLVSGRDLDKVVVLSPAGLKLVPIGPRSESAKMRLLTLTAEQLKINKQILLQRGDEKPFLVTIPDIEPKKPEARAKETVAIGSDEAVVEGQGMGELEKVTFRGQNVSFDVVDDNTVRLKGLRALTPPATSSETTQRFEFKFKSEAKPKVVQIRIVKAKFEVN